MLEYVKSRVVFNLFFLFFRWVEVQGDLFEEVGNNEGFFLTLIPG
jgi:hypothetical protein